MPENRINSTTELKQILVDYSRNNSLDSLGVDQLEESQRELLVNALAICNSKLMFFMVGNLAEWIDRISSPIDSDEQGAIDSIERALLDQISTWEIREYPIGAKNANYAIDQFRELVNGINGRSN